MINFKCPTCGKSFNLRDEHAGRQGKCSCGAVITIPVGGCGQQVVPQTPETVPTTEASKNRTNAKGTCVDGQSQRCGNGNERLTANNLDHQLKCEDANGQPQSWVVYDKLCSRDEGAHELFGQMLSTCANGSCRLCGKNPCGGDMVTVALKQLDQMRGLVWSICRSCRSRVLSDQLNGGEAAALLQAAQPPGRRRCYLLDFEDGSLQPFVG